MMSARLNLNVIIFIFLCNFQFFLAREIGLHKKTGSKQIQALIKDVIPKNENGDLIEKAGGGGGGGNLAALLNNQGGIDTHSIGTYWSTLPGGHDVGSFLQGIGQAHSSGSSGSSGSGTSSIALGG